jgi:hypothetical protein
VPRRLRLPSVEMVSIDLYLIYEYSGVWEEEWRPIQGVLDLPSVTKEDMDHALHGWTRPLVGQLGPPPDGRLLLLPRTARQCGNRNTCPMFDRKDCKLQAKKMPWCYEPDGFNPAHRALVAEVIKLWREEVYVVVIRET